MITARILKSATLRRSHKKALDHDGIICMVIQRMRRLGMRMIYYDEAPDAPPHFAESHPTIMKFEKR